MLCKMYLSKNLKNMTVVTNHYILESSDSLVNSINMKVVLYVKLFITALE